MSLSIVEQTSKFAEDRGQGVVTVASDERRDFALAIEELQGAAARNLALGWAAEQGVKRPGVRDAARPYPVNAAGQSLLELPSSALGLDRRMAGYRVDIPITRGF